MRARGWGRIAFGLGGGHAAVSAYWAFGGTAGLATVGGELARWAREHSPAAAGALAGIAAVKLLVAALGPVVARRPNRVVRRLAGAAAVVLIGYGGVLTAGQALVAVGVVPASPQLDRTAFYGHLLLWDPWFLLWGLALWAAVRTSRR